VIVKEVSEAMSPRMTGVVLAAFAAALFLVSPAVAEINAPTQASENQQVIQKLQEAKEIAGQNARSWTQEPITSREFIHQEARINHLIEKLKHGENVSQSEIDEVLTNPETPY
jgi:hypothetical protein